MKVDDILQEHTVDIEMTILTFSLLVNNADEVAEPVELLIFLLGSEIESFDVILLDDRQLASVCTDDILYLPHI